MKKKKTQNEGEQSSSNQILTQWLGYLGCNSSCSMDSNSLRLVTTFWTFLDNWSVCSSTIFMNAASCSWYVEHNRFLFRSSMVSSCICLSFSSCKKSPKSMIFHHINICQSSTEKFSYHHNHSNIFYNSSWGFCLSLLIFCWKVPNLLSVY